MEDRSAYSPAWPLAPSVPSGFSTSQEGTAAGAGCSWPLEGLRRELLATVKGLGALGALELLSRDNTAFPLDLIPGQEAARLWGLLSFLPRAQFGEGGMIGTTSNSRDTQGPCMLKLLLSSPCLVKPERRARLTPERQAE